MGENAIRRNNCDRSDSTFSSKSSKPAAIDLRPMELADAREKQEVKSCEHFSIRGYVAEARKKDGKKCWPFSTVLDGHKDLEEQAKVLPPLHVSEFRWWACHNCLKNSNIVVGEVADTYNNGCKTTVCSSLGNAIISSHGDAVLSGFLRTSKGSTFEGRKAGCPDNTPLCVTAAECDPASSNKKEKDAAAVHPIREDYASKDHGDNADKNVNHMANGITSGATKVGPCLIVDMVTNDTGRFKVSIGTGEQHGWILSPFRTPIASQSVCHNENVSERVPLQSRSDLPIENHRIQQVSNDVFAIRNLKSRRSSFTELCRKEKLGISKNNLNKSNKQQKEVMTDSGKGNVLDVDVYKNNALNAVKSHTSKFHPVELDESDFDSSDEIIRHAIHHQHCTREKDGPGRTLHQRKIRKVRLLTDILRSEAMDASAKDCTSDKGAYNDPIMMKAAYSKPETGCASTGIDRHSDLSTQVERRVLGKRKKRKMPQDEDQDPSQMNGMKCARDEVVILKGGVENRKNDTAIVNSGSKSYLTKQRNNEKVLLDKKKHKSKRSQMVDGQSSVASFQESISPEVCVTRRDEAIKYTGTETVPFKSAPDVFPERVDIKLADAVAQIHDEGSILGKKNSKVSLFEDGKSSLMHWQESRSGKDHIIRRCVESKHKGSATHPSKPAGDASIGGGVSHGLGHLDTHRKAIINKKQNAMPQAEGGGNMPQAPVLGSSLIVQPKASSGTRNCENSAVVQRHQRVPKNQCGKTTNQASKQAALDDIPMEIVELMAKNQHERRLSSAERTTENGYSLSGRTEKVKDATATGFSEFLGSEMLRLGHENSFHLQKVQPTNEESNTSITDKRVAPNIQKPDCNPFQSNCKYDSINFNMGQAEQPHNTMGFALFSQCREKPSSGFQFPGSGSSINCDKSFSMNEDMVERRCPPNCLQCLELYRRSHPHTVSRQSSSREDHHVWSSMVPNSFSFGINSPRKLAAESSKVNMLQQSAEPLPRGNINWDHGSTSTKPHAIQLQKQGRKVDRDTNKTTNTEYSILYTDRANEYHPKTHGPLGLYTNETIPAMHLLKLMDEGQKFTKQSPFPYDHSHKDLSGLELRQSKTNEALVHPPSSDHFDRNSHLVESLEKFPPVLKVNTVGCSFQKPEDFKLVTGTTGRLSDTLMHISFEPQGKGKTKAKNKPRFPKANRSVTKDSSAVENPESASIHDLQKGFQSASNSIPFSLHSQARNDSISTRIELEVNKKDKTAWPVVSSCSTKICTLNRNPADFTIPEAGNMYMIDGRDLKRTKGNASRKKGSLNNQEANKRQRLPKLKAIQTYVQH